MANEKPWGVMNPNSQHQIWSRWQFTIHPGGRRPDFKTVEYNFRRWLQATFQTEVGQARLFHRVVRTNGLSYEYYAGEAYVEGIPAHDPVLVMRVRQNFLRNFVHTGFGPLATSDVTATIVAGDKQDGKPAAQLVVMPTVGAK